MPSKTKVLVIHGLSSKPPIQRLHREINWCLDFLRSDQITLLYWADLAGYEPDHSNWSDPTRYAPIGKIERVKRKLFGGFSKFIVSSLENSIAAGLGLEPVEACGATCFIPPGYIAAPLERRSRERFGTHMAEMSNYFCEGSVLRNDIFNRCPYGQFDIAIGHSMGSIILADLLMSSYLLPVRKIITMGSPLGLGIVRYALQKYYPAVRPMRHCFTTGEWLNVSDPMDVISLDTTLDGEYDCKVSDVYIENDALTPEGKRHYHSLFGYLRSEPVQQLIRRSL